MIASEGIYLVFITMSFYAVQLEIPGFFMFALNVFQAWIQGRPFELLFWLEVEVLSRSARKNQARFISKKVLMKLSGIDLWTTGLEALCSTTELSALHNKKSS